MTLDQALDTLQNANISAVDNGTPVAIPQEAARAILHWHRALGRARINLSRKVNRQNKRAAARAARAAAKRAAAGEPTQPPETPATTPTL